MAVDDSYEVHHGGELTVAAAGILANDSDADGDSLAALLASGPANGSLTLDADGSFVYTPASGFAGKDSFTYRASDGTETSEPATVSIAVLDEAPLAADDIYSILASGTTTVDADRGVLANDTDVDDTLAAALVSGPTLGTLSFQSDGSFAYTPGPSFSGSDSFTYSATGGTQVSNTATVTLTAGPVARADAYSVVHDTTLEVAAAGVLANDDDADEDALSAVLDAGPGNGTLTLRSDGSFEYEPGPGFVGTDSFTYHATDGTSDSVVVEVTVDVTNEAPVVQDDAYGVFVDTPFTVDDAGVLANDGDADGDTLDAVLLEGAQHGKVALYAGGGFTYMPDPGYVGPDGFTYLATDGLADSESARVDLAVHASNEAPVSRPDVYAVNREGYLGHFREGVLANDYDPDDDRIRAELVENVSYGRLTFASDGTVAYVPHDGFVGIDQFTYRATDGRLLGSVVVARIHVLQAAPPPARSEFSVVTRENFDPWDAAKTGKTDRLISPEDIDTLMTKTGNDSVIENPASTDAERSAAIRRVAAIVTLKGALKSKGISFDNGVTLNDLNRFDALAAGPAKDTGEPGSTAKNVTYNYENAKEAVLAHWRDPKRRHFYANREQGKPPVLDYLSIQQGGIGDCYFIAPVVSMVAAGRSAEIAAMMQPIQGGAIVKVKFPGETEAVFVETPTYAEVVFYSRAHKDGLWLTVLEKAYGTLSQRWYYRTTEEFDGADGGGFLRTGIRPLTAKGVTTRQVRLNAFYSANDIERDIEAAFLKKKIVTAASPVNWAWSRNGSQDLPLSHAYAVIGYDKMTGKIKLRNPWGQDGRVGRDGKIEKYSGTFEMTAKEFKEGFLRIGFED